MRFAVVTPVYTEGSTIRASVEEVAAKFLRRHPESSLFICEDGSRDNTKQVLQQLAAEYAWCKISTNESRKGYPKAARDALLSPELDGFDYVLFMDSDGQYDPDDFERLVATAEQTGADIVMGRRSNRAEATYRVILSSGLRGIEWILFRPPCRDTTSALRLMKTDVAQKLASAVRYSQSNFWLEFTARMSLAGSQVIEIPVNYRAREGASRVYSVWRMPAVILDELRAILKTWNERHTFPAGADASLVRERRGVNGR